MQPFNPLGPGYHERLYEIYREYRENDPVHCAGELQPSGQASWFLFRYADVNLVLKDPRFVREWTTVFPETAQPSPAADPARRGAADQNSRQLSRHGRPVDAAARSSRPHTPSAAGQQGVYAQDGRGACAAGGGDRARAAPAGAERRGGWTSSRRTPSRCR